jgi:PAS domain S-box-containing protein
MRDESGRITRWFGTNTDVTEQQALRERLRASEEQLSRLYESSIVGIISADPDCIYEANDVFLEMIGYDREELKARRISWRAITPAEFKGVDDRAVQELLATGSCRPFEKEYIRKDGTRVPILLGATLLDREPLRWVCFIVDLTDRKHLESRLLHKQKLESIGLLAGGVAHDFNNLLVAILGNASLGLEMAAPEDSLGQLLAEIVNAAERAAHLTRQMLAYAGKGRFIITDVNLSALVREMIQLLQPLISGNISVSFDLTQDIPPVKADPGQLQQIVMNLAVNAAEAIGEKPVTILVKTGVRVVEDAFVQELKDAEIQPGNYVFLEVRDSGCGMDAETMSRIFDPFFTTKFTGRGLGLAAVSGIVRSHRGAIHASSAPGMGTTFLVLLPLAACAEDARAAEPRKDSEEPKGTGTVLVVDDEDLVRRTARAALERRGYEVLPADSGAAAIETLRRDGDRIGAVLLDVNMPGMNGRETLAQLRLIRPDVRVLISSGYSEDETRRIFGSDVFTGFIQKPYTVNGLAEAIKRVLKGV